MRRRVAVPMLLACLASGCVYYNSMWSAERLAHDARRQEAEGQVAMAKLTWARAAVKAESIAIRHPRSRWADDALTLQVEGMAHSGNCAMLDGPRGRAEASVTEDALRERIALAGAKCALAQGHPGAVAGMLTDVLVSKDDARRSEAYDLLGQSASARADWAEAIDAFSRSKQPNASMSRARALIAAGRTNEARSLLDTLAHQHFDDSLWAGTLDAIARTAGDSVASLALDSLLVQARLTAGAKARLLLADGDRLRQGGRHAAAGARYDFVQRLVPDSVEGAHAEVRSLLAAAGTVSGPAELAPIAEQVDRILARGFGSAQAEAQALQRVLAAVRRPDSSDIGWFRAGEFARDTLVAPALAAAWFGKIPQRFPQSLFAAKALIALAVLRPAVADSVRAVLDSSFPESPYTLALKGNVSPAYEALEDSLGEALGLSKLGVRTVLAQLIASPVPGQKGPPLDPVDLAAAGAHPSAAPPAPRPTSAQGVRRPAGQPIPQPGGSPPGGRPLDRP